MLSCPDWSRPLPRPLTIPTVVELKTLADVRDLVDRHLPAQYRHKPTWRARLSPDSQGSGRGDVNAGTKLRQRAGVKMHHGGWQIGFCG